MDSNQVHYEGGDVLVKPSWESPSFFLVHREVLSDRSPYFQAMLADRWSKPRILDSDKEGAPLWTLYIATNTQDPENEPFILTTKASYESELTDGRGRLGKYLYGKLYTGLLSEYNGRDGHGVHLDEKCSCEYILLCSRCAELLARVNVIEVHKCIFELIYGKRLKLPKSMGPERKILFLADLIYFGHLYNILDIVSHKIESDFLAIEGLERHYHNSPQFFLEVGYYLQSQVMFVEGMKYIVGKGLLDVTTLPDIVLGLESGIRERFSQHLQQHIKSISRVLAFREQKETTYEQPYRSLTEPELKIREVAKTTLMNWVTRNILQIVELDSYMKLPAWNWHKLVTAVAEQDFSHLHGISLRRLGMRYAIKPALLGAAIKQLLERLDREGSLQGPRTSTSNDSMYDMFPCPHDNCNRRHDFWVSFDLRRDDRWQVGHLLLPWKVKTKVDNGKPEADTEHDPWADASALGWDVEKEPEVVPRDIEEYPTEPASGNYLACLGLADNPG